MGASWGRLGRVVGVLEVSCVSRKLVKPMKNQHVSFWYPLASWAVLWPSWARLGVSWRDLVLDFHAKRCLHVGLPF